MKWKTATWETATWEDTDDDRDSVLDFKELWDNEIKTN